MSALPSSTDLFVIGGGPAGLAAALAARRRGLEVTLADSSVPPIDKACGEGIMPDGLAAARALGLDLNAEQGHPFRGIRFCDPDAAVEAAFPQGHGLGLRRTALHELMVNQAIDAGVRLAWGVQRYRDHPEGVIAATAWCALAGLPAPMAATRPCAAGRAWMPATVRATASASAATMP